jgi:hypothetical protein
LPQLAEYLPPLPAFSAASLPRLGASSGPSNLLPPLPSASTQAPWIMVALLVVVGVVLWRVLSRSLGASHPWGWTRWQLGPWPVKPAEIASRAELVQAFDYLALLRLGPSAYAWNHRSVVTALVKLQGADPATTAATERLASLYEQARYAPEAGPLPTDALVAARRHLCHLAGIPCR